MDRRLAIRDSLTENRIFLNRVVIAFVFVLFLTVGLITRLMYLQIVGHQHYTTLARENRIKIEPLPPIRGLIYDRNGKLLAENITTYSLEIIPDQLENLDDTLARLQQLLRISDEKIDQFQKLQKRSKSFSSLPLLQQLTEEEVARFAVVRPYFKGVDIYARMVRRYPYNELTAHVVGYVGRISENELKNLPNDQYRGTLLVGKGGIEKAYEEQLHGKAGYQEIETNAQLRVIQTLDTIDPIPGFDIYLTLDIDLQQVAYEALGKYNGAAVAIEIATGDVLALVSRPSFNPNLFVSGISNNEYNTLRDSEDQPLYNRALRGLYPPGSTIKPFVALAGLEHNVTDASHAVNCPGYYQLPNAEHKYRDWKRWGHGSVNMNDAIAESCDVYFYDLSLKLGIDDMHEFLQKFGFGQKTGIDLTGEAEGLLPSKAWKRKAKKRSWFPGETLITGIGQGYNQATPLQLARATATLANRGKVVTPRLAGRIVDGKQTVAVERGNSERIALKKQHLDYITDAMIDVVHSSHGTASKHVKDIPYLMAGKTGTAQVFTVKQDERYNEDAIDFKMRDHALFVAFAPAHAPKIAVAVIAEHGGHGGAVAAPIAEKIITAYLKPKQEPSDAH